MFVTEPGFSTKKQITQVSGRGVGMNSVKNKISAIGGTLEIESKPKGGSAFKIKLPLSMAIVQALLVGMGEETLAIPLANISETIKVSGTLIHQVEQGEMLSWRNSVLPLIRLKEKLGFGEGGIAPPGNISIVICEVGSKKIGFVVDHFLGQQEVVIKTLREPLKNMKGIAGATILGDGRVAMIADIASMI